jgi:hypothetical protein
LRAVHLSFEFDQKINETALGVPATLQLLKIVPRPPMWNRPTGVMRTFMIPSGCGPSQPPRLVRRARLTPDPCLVRYRSGGKRPLREPADPPALG